MDEGLSSYSIWWSPTPSQVFVLLEEHEESIEDGYMRMENPVYGSENSWENVWWGLPSSRHNLSGNVSFLDGHSAPRATPVASSRSRSLRTAKRSPPGAMTE